MIFRTRFAPSPTGPLHLGHAYSALLAHDIARAKGGEFFLRFDDIDQTRTRKEWRAQILTDLAWLGLTWDGPVWSQHERKERYANALKTLWKMGLLYPCRCSRADIKAAANAPQEGAPLNGPDGVIYPGTCRHNPDGAFPESSVLRLNMKKALQYLDIKSISVNEDEKTLTLNHAQMLGEIGDAVLARKDLGASYHLSIVIDDAEQKITDVIRGKDLSKATYIHVLLQKLLGLPSPKYLHHKLIRDKNGKRLAKRDDSRAIARFRDDGLTPRDIRALIGLEVNPSET